MWRPKRFLHHIHIHRIMIINFDMTNASTRVKFYRQRCETCKGFQTACAITSIDIEV